MSLINRYNSLSIKYKLLSTVLVSITILFTIFVSINYFTFTSNLNKSYYKKLDVQSNEFNNSLKTLTDKAVNTSVIFSNLTQIKEAFLLTIQANDDYCSSFFLNEEFENLHNQLELTDGENANIRFIKPNGNVIYQLGDKSCSKQTVSRKTFDRVVKTKIAYSGIDFIDDKILISSIVPVFEGQKLIGIIESIYTFDVLLELLNNNNIAIFVKNHSVNNDGNTGSNKFIAYSKQAVDINKYEELKDEGKELNFYSDAIYGVFDINSEFYTAQVLSKISNKEVNDEKTSMFILTLISFIGILLAIALIVYFTINKMLIIPLDILTKRVNLSSKGHITKALKVKSEDEIGRALKANNELMLGIEKSAIFASEIGGGNLDAEYSILSKEDKLGNSLIKLREDLLLSRNNEEKQKKENIIRNWFNEGLAKFGDILRQDNDDLTKLSDKLLNNIIHYIEAVQGGIFLVDDEGEELEQISSYAYNRKKFIEKRVPVKEGILGACILEKQHIYLKEIPENYIELTSGLGDAKPNHILLIPLMFNDVVLGVMEFAFLKEVEEHKISFCNNIAESIASTLTTVKVNKQTAELLEQTQQQTEEMSAQEEEMRQNMEEMQATQEETTRRESEFKGIMNSIDNTLIRIELNTDGEVISVNNKFLETFTITNNEIIKTNLYQIIDTNHLSNYKLALMQAINNETGTDLIKFIKKDKQEVWLHISITPVLNNEELIKIELLAIDITKQKKIENELIKKEKDLLLNIEELSASYQSASNKEVKFNNITKSLDNSFLTAEIDENGIITNYNDVFNKNFGIKNDNTKFIKLLNKDFIKNFEASFRLSKEQYISEIFKYICISNKEKMIHSTFTPIFNEDNILEKIIFIGFENVKPKDNLIIDLNEL